MISDKLTTLQRILAVRADNTIIIQGVIANGIVLAQELDPPIEKIINTTLKKFKEYCEEELLELLILDKKQTIEPKVLFEETKE